MNSDSEKARSDQLRWLILQVLHASQPLGSSEQTLLAALTLALPELTALELRQHLGDLLERQLIAVSKVQRNLSLAATAQSAASAPQWLCQLRRAGIDIVEYVASCPSGIARPRRYG